MEIIGKESLILVYWSRLPCVWWEMEMKMPIVDWVLPPLSGSNVAQQMAQAQVQAQFEEHLISLVSCDA